jgi:hypothetical protein
MVMVTQAGQDQITVRADTKAKLAGRKFKAEVKVHQRLTWDEFLLEATK